MFARPRFSLRPGVGGEAKRRNTRRRRFILGANAPTGITLGLFCRSEQKIPEETKSHLRGHEVDVYLRDRQQRDSDNGGLIAEPSHRMLCSERT